MDLLTIFDDFTMQKYVIITCKNAFLDFHFDEYGSWVWFLLIVGQKSLLTITCDKLTFNDLHEVYLEYLTYAEGKNVLTFFLSHCPN